jgi:COMPASS component SWD1
MGVYVGCFSHRGDQVYLGSPRGILTVADTWTRAVTFQTRIVEAQMKVPVKQVAVSRRGNFILFNTNDKSIRAMPIDATTGHPMPYLTVRYRDNVQGYQWAACCFSPDEDFVVAGSQVKGSHELYVWDRLTGNLKRKLEGPAEGGSLRDLAWHPHRPIIAAVSQEDRVYIWANSTEENWSAFAPDFREIEENTDYREMEDEFDIVGWIVFCSLGLSLI